MEASDLFGEFAKCTLRIYIMYWNKDDVFSIRKLSIDDRMEEMTKKS